MLRVVQVVLTRFLDSWPPVIDVQLTAVFLKASRVPGNIQTFVVEEFFYNILQEIIRVIAVWQAVCSMADEIAKDCTQSIAFLC